ncbi:hypothetical protein HYU15_03080 [Candidatus Woesearchaeota archaeon]|nr:hypothetical protein [Candidatus Woesearchaeota archaeon]
MAKDVDFDLYPDRLGPIDALSKRLLGGRNTHMVLNGLLQRASRMALRRIPAGVRKKGLFPSDETKAILEELLEKHTAAEGHEKTAYGLILDNMLAFRDTIWLFASRFYASMWTRDGYFMARATGINSLEKKVIGQIAGYQLPNGQTPTEIYFPGIVKHCRDDEATPLLLLWGLQAGFEDETKLAAAWRFSKQHVNGKGKYVSPAGTRRCIVDALEFPEGSCISSVQGIYAVAAELAYKRGLGNREDAEKAAEEYRNLARKTSTGFMPLSDTMPNIIDPFAVFGEYLALTILGREILGKEIVENTLKAAERTKAGTYGYRIIGEDRRSIPPQHFIHGWGDDYQVKNIWPLFVNTLLAVAEMHRIIDGSYRPEILKMLDEIEWAEYKIARGMRGGPQMDPVKRWQAWTAYLVQQYREVDVFLKAA